MITDGLMDRLFLNEEFTTVYHETHCNVYHVMSNTPKYSDNVQDDFLALLVFYLCYQFHIGG